MMLTYSEFEIYQEATNFLKKKAENEWMYANYDLSTYVKTNSSKGIKISQKIQNLVDMTEMRKEYRKVVGKNKINFKVSYDIIDMNVMGNQAIITLNENISYFITNGNGEPSYSSEVYTVYLTRQQDKWNIIDIDIRYDILFNKIKDNKFNKTSHLQSRLLKLKTSQKHSVYYEYVEPTAAVNPITNFYSPAQAAAYAAIYAKEYNSKFHDATLAGGDCANFGSQCVWAGFGGDLTRCNITNTSYPFDYSGTAAAPNPPASTCWNQQYSGTGNGGSNWFLSQWLYDYAVNSTASPSEHGWKAITGTAWNGSANVFPVGRNYHGALFFVQGSGSGSGAQYGHTIMIFSASGNNPSNMYYSAHTSNQHNVCLGDSDYMDFPIRYVIPTEYKIQTVCTGSYTTHSYPYTSSGYSAVCSRCGYENMYMNFKWARYAPNSSVQIQVSEIRSNRCYEIYAEVKRGTQKVDEFTVYNTSTLSSVSTKMKNEGLYTVSVRVKDKPDGITKNYEYAVRVGGIE